MPKTIDRDEVTEQKEVTPELAAASWGRGPNPSRGSAQLRGLLSKAQS